MRACVRARVSAFSILYCVGGIGLNTTKVGTLTNKMQNDV